MKMSLIVRRSYSSLIYSLRASREIVLCSQPVSGRVIMCRNVNAYSSEPMPHKPKGFMRTYENFLNRRYPKVYIVHRLVVDGSKWCISDIKTYCRLRRDFLRGTRTIAELDQNELEILIQTNEEIAKLVVIAILIPLPMTVYILGAAVIFFPRLILTRHFWTNEQRRDFWVRSLDRSAKMHFRPIREKLKKMGVNLPSSFEDLKTLRAPEIERLSFVHLYHLARIHRIIPFMGVRRLYLRADALRHLDHFLLQSGSVDAMSDQQLYLQLYLRRLRYYGLSIEEMRKLLKDWVHYSSACGLRASAYLHLPVLFHPFIKEDL